jgi:hypothetical protein
MRQAEQALSEAITKSINGVLKGRSSRNAALVAASVCNAKYMSHVGWYFLTHFHWRGQAMQAQFSHKDSLHWF